MNKKNALTSLMLPLLAVMILQPTPSVVAANVIRVPTDYAKIKWAIGNATLGDIIQVASGIYDENNIVINKSLTLIGENRKTTIIDGGNTNMVFSVIANNVTITGFTIRNTLIFHGIRITSSYSNVSDNIIENNWRGIWLVGGNSNTIRSNVVINNQYGILLESSQGNIIRGNAVLSGDYGIRIFNDSQNNHIENNIIAKHTQWYGIWLDDSNSNMIHHNNFIDNLAQAYGNSLLGNTWDNGKGRGNYWSDYVGLDNGSGSRVAGDGIGDTLLPHDGVDSYPLMIPWGDVNDDNIINGSDLMMAATVFGTIQGQLQYEPRVDLNSEGVIDIFDVVIIAVNYNKSSN